MEEGDRGAPAAARREGPAMANIRILIVEDHAVVRAGLRLLIDAQPDLRVVGEAADAPEAWRLVGSLTPDVVSLDLSLPGDNGLTLLARLRREHPAVRVLVLTMHDDPGHLRMALAAGASGYVVKTAPETEYVAALRAVHQGRTFVDLGLSEALTQAMVGAEAGTPPPAEAARLSPREREVLERLAHGYTNQQIADRLFLSVKTVETYRARIAEKLGLRSRVDFIRYALETGLLGGPRPEP
jgi:DNA-binding NarL/FixJ family response regulator